MEAVEALLSGASSISSNRGLKACPLHAGDDFVRLCGTGVGGSPFRPIHVNGRRECSPPARDGHGQLFQSGGYVRNIGGSWNVQVIGENEYLGASIRTDCAVLK